MRIILLIVLASTMFAPAVSALTLKETAAAKIRPWGAFSAKPFLRKNAGVKVEIVEIRTIGGVRPEAFWTADKPMDFWVAEKHSQTPAGDDVLLWADSRDCPALVPTLAKLADLEPIQIDPPGVPKVLHDILFDGVDYELQAPGVYPKESAMVNVRLSGNVNSPLGAWVAGALQALAPCWSDRPPI